MVDLTLPGVVARPEPPAAVRESAELLVSMPWGDHRGVWLAGARVASGDDEFDAKGFALSLDIDGEDPEEEGE